MIRYTDRHHTNRKKIVLAKSNLDTQFNGTHDFGHVRVHFCHASAGEDCGVVVVASELSNYKKRPAEVGLAGCKQFDGVF